MPAADSLRVFNAPEVVVSSTRSPVKPEDSPQKVDRLDVRRMQDLGVSDPASILSLSPGVFTKDYGPAQLSTISIRGTAAEENLVMIDGIRLNNVQNGLVDLFLLPMSGLGSVEISHGGASSLYGADAVGGVVSMTTRVPRSSFAEINLGAGSYGDQTTGASASQAMGGASVSIMVQRQRGVNDYNFNFNDGLLNFPMKRVGADYVRDDELFKLDLDGGLTSIMAQNTSADRGTPGAVTGPYFVGTAREGDRSTIGLVQHSGPIGFSSYTASLGIVYSYLNYTDPSLLINGRETNDYYKMMSLQPAVRFSLTGTDLSFGVDGESDRASSSEMNGIKARDRFGVFASGSFVLNRDLELKIFPAIRFDDYSDFGRSADPRLGVNLKPSAELPVHIRASAGTSYRAPTFNDLYYAGAGNPNLKAEKAFDYDAGIVLDLPFGAMLDAGYYDIETRDGIVWLPSASSVWLPRNYSKIESRGLEFSAQANIGGLFAVRGVYSLGKTLDESDPSDPSTYMKQMIYLPQEQGTVFAAVSPWILDFSVMFHYDGFRYVTQSNDDFLPSFTTFDLSASARIQIGKLTVRPLFTVRNLFNKNYDVIPQYPSPLRSFNFNLKIRFDQIPGEN